MHSPNPGFCCLLQHVSSIITRLLPLVTPALDSNISTLVSPIPPELGQLSQLEVLSLARNALTGPIPPGLGQLHRLRDLYLSHNQLSGPVPPELGAIPDLNQVFLNGNDLTGCLPAHWEGYHVSVMSGDIAERSTWLPFCED